MKKVLFTIQTLDIGGPEKSLMALLDNVDYEKFDVSLLVLKPGGVLTQYINENCHILDTDLLITAAMLPAKNTAVALKTMLRHHEVEMLISSVFSIIKHLMFRKNMNIERQKFFKKYVERIPRLNEKFDIAIGFSGGIASYYVAECVNAKIKYNSVICDQRILKMDNNIQLEYFSKMTGSLAVSKSCAQIFEDVFPSLKGKTKVLNNYIPFSFYSKLPVSNGLIKANVGTTNITTVCRIDLLKGLELTIDTARILDGKGYNFRWYILGDGKNRKVIEKQLSKKHMEGKVIILGFQLNPMAMFELCDIYVHPSRTEGKSNAVDEAKYSGLPIVVTNYPTVGDQIINEVNGLICRMSGKSIADSVERLINDKNLRETIGHNNKGHIDAPADLSEYLISLIND